jgi:hypothetical protein
VSNNFLLNPEKSCDIYKHRWQIENMFKRLKQNFPLKYFLGDNQNAFEIKICCGIIIQLLMLVVQKRTKRRWAYSNLVSMIRLHLMSYINMFSFMANLGLSDHQTTRYTANTVLMDTMLLEKYNPIPRIQGMKRMKAKNRI